MTSVSGNECPLCRAETATVLFRDSLLRVIEVDDADYPGFTRVIVNRHVAEMTDLSAAERQRVMDVVWLVEQAQRATLDPDKINVASLGNMVPHVHWHVIPRWRGDRHFPDAIWAAPKSPAGATASHLEGLRERLTPYRMHLLASLESA